MSEKYTPRVGDKVRATLGENVLVGIVESIPSGYECNINIGPQVRLVNTDVGWQFEQITSVPSKFGAVIRRADGERFTLVEPDAVDDLAWFGRLTGWMRFGEVTAGGFTVLFDGVDE